MDIDLDSVGRLQDIFEVMAFAVRSNKQVVSFVYGILPFFGSIPEKNTLFLKKIKLKIIQHQQMRIVVVTITTVTTAL